MVVVEVLPGLQGIGAVLVGGEDLPVGPALLQGAVEPFGFTVLPEMAGLDQDVLCTQTGQHGLEIVGEPVSERAIGHHPFYWGTVGGHERCGPFQEPGAGGTFHIGVDFDERQSGVIIHGHVEVVETDPGMPCRMVAGQLIWVGLPASSIGDSPEFLYVYVDNVPGSIAFIPPIGSTGGADPDSGEWVQIPQLGNVRAGQDPGNRAGTDTGTG